MKAWKVIRWFIPTALLVVGLAHFLPDAVTVPEAYRDAFPWITREHALSALLVIAALWIILRDWSWAWSWWKRWRKGQLYAVEDAGCTLAVSDMHVQHIYVVVRFLRPVKKASVTASVRTMVGTEHERAFSIGRVEFGDVQKGQRERIDVGTIYVPHPQWTPKHSVWGIPGQETSKHIIKGSINLLIFSINGNDHRALVTILNRDSGFVREALVMDQDSPALAALVEARE
jgi:hypothetical protein